MKGSKGSKKNSASSATKSKASKKTTQVDYDTEQFSDEPQEFEFDHHDGDDEHDDSKPLSFHEDFDGDDANDGDGNNQQDNDDDIDNDDNQVDQEADEQRKTKKHKTEEDIQKGRLARTEQKSLLKERKLQKPGAPIIIIFKHDASRIIQCCLKYGTPAQRDQIAEELSGQYARLSQSQYGRFIVSKILNYCSQKYRGAVISDFYGKVRKLIRHKEASLILDEAYSQFANAQQRSALMEEFYGPEFAVFKRLDGTRTLQSLLESSPEKKPSILRYLRQTLDGVLQKGTFNLAKTPILHRAILEYITYSEAVKVSKDMIELLKDHLVHILHTRDGARIAQYCILHATPKDRKHIIKSFKGFVHAIAKEQYGHSVLLTCFECIDDTVIVSKSLVAELLQAPASGAALASETSAGASSVPIGELLRDKYASRVVLFLLAGRNKKFQPAYLIDELAQMDQVRAQTSKKEDALRRSQLLEAASPLLITAVAANVDELLRDRNGVQVTVETVYTAHGDVSPILDAILQVLPANLDPKGVAGLKAERDAEKHLSQGLDMTSSLLVNRASTTGLKQLVGKYVPASATGSADQATVSHPKWKSDFALSFFDVIAPRWAEWIAYCAADPRSRGGVALIFVSINDDEEQSSAHTANGFAIETLIKYLQS
eukprot:jgi/Hompol1/5089/HPOL_000485-RA